MAEGDVHGGARRAAAPSRDTCEEEATRHADKDLLARLSSRRASIRRPAELEFFDRFQSPLERMLRRLLGRDTDDALQEVFLDIFRGLPAFRGHSKLSTWIYRVALRRAWKIAATRRRHASSAQSEEVNAIPSTNVSVDEELAAEELAQRFQHALDQLDLTQRTVMALCAIEGLSSSEIGAVLGVPVGTVHSRLHRARERVRALLGMAP